MADSLHLVCPHCERVNRIPQARLGDSPRCGHCHQGLFTGSVIELTASTFRQQVGRNDIPVVVDFWAPWCGPCQMMAPHYTAAAAELEPQVRLAKLNTEATGSRRGIRHPQYPNPGAVQGRTGNRAPGRRDGQG